jgi:hypothetical protein
MEGSAYRWPFGQEIVFSPPLCNRPVSEFPALAYKKPLQESSRQARQFPADSIAKLFNGIIVGLLFMQAPHCPI